MLHYTYIKEPPNNKNSIGNYLGSEKYHKAFEQGLLQRDFQVLAEASVLQVGSLLLTGPMKSLGFWGLGFN